MTIKISTTDIEQDYEILDAVFALDSSTAKIFSSANPGAAFQGVNKQLREVCSSLGGDAVIGCQFEYRNALADGIFGKKQSIEIFAYGTAVKFK